jgi:hypothetical protein
MTVLQLGVCVAPSYLADAGSPSHLNELHDPRHRIVQFRWTNKQSYVMTRGDGRVTMGRRYMLAVDYGNAYLTAGLSGLGVL